MLNRLILLCSLLMLFPATVFSQDAETHLRQAAVYDSLVFYFLDEDQFGFSITELPAASQDSIRLYAHKAVEAYTAALAINSDIAYAYNNRGLMWSYLDECVYLENEIIDFSTAIRLGAQSRPHIDCENYNEGDYYTYCLLENACFQFGNPDSAWQACTRRLSICPADYDYRRHRAFLNVLLNRYDDAISDIDSMFTARWTMRHYLSYGFCDMRAEETKSAVFCSRAFAKAMMGDTLGALQDFEQARADISSLLDFYRTAMLSFFWEKHIKFVRLSHTREILYSDGIGDGFNLLKVTHHSILPRIMAKLNNQIASGYANVDEYVYRALAYNLTGNTAEARRDLTTALALARDAPQRIFIRAMLHGYFPR